MKSVYTNLVFILVLVLLTSNSRALGVDYLGIETRLKSNMTAHTAIKLILDSNVSHLDYYLRHRIFNLEAESKDRLVECELTYIDRSKISCDFSGPGRDNKTELELIFNTMENVKRSGINYEFDGFYPVDYPVNRMFSTIYLPVRATLATNESFSPRYGKTVSDGKHIIVYWERENIKQGDDLQFSVTYTMPVGAGSLYEIAIMVVLAVSIIVIMGVVYIKKMRVESISVIMPLLKADEKRMIDILTKHKGEVNQRVLVRESDFSKAKVSRLMASLKERGIIDMERMGRTNKVTLKVKR